MSDSKQWVMTSTGGRLEGGARSTMATKHQNHFTTSHDTLEIPKTCDVSAVKGKMRLVNRFV